MCPIAWDGDPPSEPRLPVFVVVPRPNEPVIVRLLGPWRAVWLHWLDPERGLPNGRSLPCKKEECSFEHNVNPPFWYAYAAAQRSDTRPEAVAVHQDAPLFGKMGQSFRQFANGDRQAHNLKMVTRWIDCVCPITEPIALELGKHGEPRGLVLELSRVRGRRELAGKILERCNPADWPPAFEVEPILLRMWRRRGLKGGA